MKFHRDGPSGIPKDAELTALQEAQDALRPRLTETERKLFHELTGLQLHAFWHRPPDSYRPLAAPILCPSAVGQGNLGAKPSVACSRCTQARWKPPESAARKVRRVIGLCGRTSLCATVSVELICPVTLVVQGPGKNKLVGRRPLPKAPNARTAEDGISLRLAEHLLIWLHRGLESTLQARMCQAKLRHTDLQSQRLIVENARLRKDLRRRILETHEPPPPASGARARQIMQAMLDYMHLHRDRPITLTEVADALRMNPAYLSNLFSKTAGVTFRDCLNEFRLANAERLLEQTVVPVAKVASAAGYASSRHLRDAFKAREGIPPAVWRQTHRAALQPSNAGL